MAFLGNILLILALALVLVLAVISIIRGRKGMKMSKLFATADKKVKTGYWIVSAIHMWAGILITVCYAIAVILVIAQL